MTLDLRISEEVSICDSENGPSAGAERKLTLTPRFFGRSDHF